MGGGGRDRLHAVRQRRTAENRRPECAVQPFSPPPPPGTPARKIVRDRRDVLGLMRSINMSRCDRRRVARGRGRSLVKTWLKVDCRGRGRFVPCRDPAVLRGPFLGEGRCSCGESSPPIPGCIAGPGEEIGRDKRTRNEWLSYWRLLGLPAFCVALAPIATEFTRNSQNTPRRSLRRVTCALGLHFQYTLVSYRLDRRVLGVSFPRSYRVRRTRGLFLLWAVDAKMVCRLDLIDPLPGVGEVAALAAFGP